ncbi:MAG: hypothetical protein J07HQW1_01167 [Haloquadratum walsbyi J07HQW1]|uniref:Uncharacterized protein n=1 Tax=Haloquadratum walsbyi J07HQW1 TaxID=1238424 RepID=U1N3L4_9EURY|nr:MAG: hypothetical protein J07HQW1_01167 [Haloquadratum walsbyi J07HQW1]
MGPVVGSLLGVPHLSQLPAPAPGTPIHSHVRAPDVVFALGVRQISTDTDTDTDSELLCVVFARWLLFAQRALCFQSGRTLILEPPVFGRSTTLGS